MGRKKLERFEDNIDRYNIIQDGKPKYGQLMGKWKSEQFQNSNDLVVELGCGNGEYTVGLGEKFPDRNFVGIDIKGSRIWVGSTYAIENKLDNVAFLRLQMLQMSDHFGKNEIDELWITFPDPRPRGRDERRRLTAPRHLAMYKSLLKPEGWVKFKTDSTELFEYTLSLFESKVKIKNLLSTKDLYNSPYMDEHHGVKTKYEKIFVEKGEDIKYLKFQFA